MAMPIPMPRGHADDAGARGPHARRRVVSSRRGLDPTHAAGREARAAHPLRDGDTLDLTAGLLRRTIHGHAFAMYGFNGQVPGPLIRVPQGATITVRFHNRIDLPSSVHWHGVRLDNRFDGAVGVTQEPVPPGGDFVYTVQFPDAGLYWYHPHVREDIEQAMGLFGNMLRGLARLGLLLAGQPGAGAGAERSARCNADTLIPYRQARRPTSP